MLFRSCRARAAAARNDDTPRGSDPRFHSHARRAPAGASARDVRAAPRACVDSSCGDRVRVGAQRDHRRMVASTWSSSFCCRSASCRSKSAICFSFSAISLACVAFSWRSRSFSRRSHSISSVRPVDSASAPDCARFRLDQRPAVMGATVRRSDQSVQTPELLPILRLITK